MEKINLAEKLSQFDSYWDPKILGELNGQQVKVAKLHGEFVWHKHDREDELFLVLSGRLEMQFRDHVVTLRKGEFIIVPRGTDHCPRAPEETHVLLFEPVSTLNTGDAGGPRTVRDPDRI